MTLAFFGGTDVPGKGIDPVPFCRGQPLFRARFRRYRRPRRNRRSSRFPASIPYAGSEPIARTALLLVGAASHRRPRALRPDSSIPNARAGDALIAIVEAGDGELCREHAGGCSPSGPGPRWDEVGREGIAGDELAARNVERPEHSALISMVPRSSAETSTGYERCRKGFLCCHHERTVP